MVSASHLKGPAFRIITEIPLQSYQLILVCKSEFPASNGASADFRVLKVGNRDRLIVVI